jgi:hypothetical protein
MKKKVLIGIVGLITGLPLIGFLVLKWGVLPPEKLTPRVQQGVEGFLNGRFECEKVELAFWETWPRLGVRVTSGRLLSYALGEADTLLTFERGVLSLSLPDYLWRDKVTIHRISLWAPRLYAKIDSCGQANWEIVKETGNEEGEVNIPITVQRIRIRDAYVKYEDFSEGIYAEVEGISLRCGEGMSQEGGESLRLETALNFKAFDNGSYVLEEPLDLQLAGEIAWTNDFRQWIFRNGELCAGKIPFDVEGSVMTTEGGEQIIDVQTALKVSRLADLLEMISPKLHADVGKELKQGIDSLILDASLHVDPLCPDSSVSIVHLCLKGSDAFLDFDARVSSLFDSPAVEVSLDGDINFSRLSEKFIHPDSLRLQGRVMTDLTAIFSVSDLTSGRYDRITAGGHLTLDTLRVFSHPYAINAFVSGVHLFIDSTRNDLLQASLLIDSLRLHYADAMDTRLTHLTATARTTPLRDTTSVTPLSAHIHADFLRTRLPDSTRLSARQADITVDIRPSVSNRRRPAISATVAADTLRYFALPVRSGLSFANFKLALAPRTPRRADTTGTVSRRRRPPRFSTDSLRSTPPSSLATLWSLGGTLSFSSARLFSRYYPLPMRMDETSVAFNANTITFTNARFHAGSNLFTLTGEVLNLRRAFLRGDTLKGTLLVESEYIDCNQLIRVAARGLQYAEERAILTDTLPEDLSETADTLVTFGDTTPTFFVVPPSLDLTLHLRAGQIDYKDLLLREVVGEVGLRNQSIRLKKLEMDSNIGKGSLTFFYTARDRHGATTGLDLDINGVLVERLLRLYPSVDSLLPMLRSFEGILDGRLTALCDIDSTGSLDLGSLNSLAFLSGRNLVLLDGETFAEISKTLMFKNKERNMIDRLSVDLSIRDRRIEVFPFLLEMDRYRVAVAGTHNLDQSFNYHISVLRSPVPFKLGIDVNGTLERPRYKITKCRFKNTFDPAREQPLIDTKLNLQTVLISLLRRHTDD